MYLEKQKAVDNLTVLRDVFCEVLEELAFLFAESASGDWTHTFNTLEYFHASIRFKGLENHIGGEIGIVCPDNLGWTLASNILGIEGEAIENSVCGKDALREFLNIICGRFLILGMPSLAKRLVLRRPFSMGSSSLSA